MADAGTPCRCGCTDPRGRAVHAIATALAVDDLDRAIDAGLLTCVPCPGCDADCSASVIAARDSRVGALAARERFRAREARLQHRARERAARRAVAVGPQPSDGQAPRPPLPSAAAAALARAKARAAGTK